MTGKTKQLGVEGGRGVMTSYFATGIYLQKWTSIRNWKGYSLLNVMLLWIHKVDSLVHLFQRSTSTPKYTYVGIIHIYVLFH